ncbi:hypothetical protein GA0115234_100911 [Streptomyces sp. DvalAA-43]|nr:hypothetical protein GA0115234_100911 [Streptomyces sp. DvalAA-43]
MRWMDAQGWGWRQISAQFLLVVSMFAVLAIAYCSA